jgi:hypothetical protein
VYEETYKPDRDSAWDMRALAPGQGKIAALARLPAVSWAGAIELAKTQTRLLDFLTAGRTWSNEDLFSRLAARAFIPSSQDVSRAELPAGTPEISDTVMRSGAAWFLWRLVAENRSAKTLLTRCSSRYRNRPSAASPIADIPLESAFFDSVLGCVEREIMNLPDGKSFFPQEAVRGADFLAMLGKAGQAR